MANKHKHKWIKLQSTAIDSYLEQCKKCGEYRITWIKNEHKAKRKTTR